MVRDGETVRHRPPTAPLGESETGHLMPLCLYHRASLVAQMVKHLPAMWKTQVQLLGREDPLEKEMATHSSTFAWKIPWMEEPGRPGGHKESDTTERLHSYSHSVCTIREANSHRTALTPFLLPSP